MASRRLINALKAVAALLVLIAITTAAIALVPRLQQAAQESSCTRKLSKLSQALADYYHEKHAFPPRVDKNETAWLDLIRPYLTGTQGVDDRAAYVRQFFPVAHQGARPDYLHVVGIGTLFDQTLQLGATQVYDGIENTLMIIEAPDLEARGVAEGEIEIADLAKLADGDGNIPAASIHPSGRGMIFADGLIFRLIKPLPAATMKSLMTTAGHDDGQRSKLVAEGFLVPAGGREIAH